MAEKKRIDRQDPAKREKYLAAGRRERASEPRKRWVRQDVLSGRRAERSRGYYRKHYEKHREKICARQRERRRRPGEQKKEKARHLANLVVRVGILTRLPCQVCGREKTEIAHRNYDNPFDFFWACSLHHRQYDHGLIDEFGNELEPVLTNGDTTLSF